MLKVGPNAGKYARILSAELYSSLAESKVIEEAALRSGKEVKRVNSSDPGTESPDESGSGGESGGGSGGNEDGGGSLI